MANEEWEQARDELRRAVSVAGYPKELGDLLAGKWRRLTPEETAYLQNLD